LIRAAADKYEFTVELLLAIGSRETNLDPQYQSHPGDFGHGFSMWQIDIRSFAEWIKTGAWRDVGAAVMKAAEILDSKRSAIKSKNFVWSGADVERVTTAAYNCGSGIAVYNFSRYQDPDRATTGHDYSADVLYRRDVFASFLNTTKEQQ